MLIRRSPPLSLVASLTLLASLPIALAISHNVDNEQSTHERCGVTSSKTLLCYYSGVEPLASIDPCFCSHLVIGGAVLSDTGKLIISSDDLVSVKHLRQKNADLHLIASVGSTFVTKANFTSLTSSSEVRKVFVESVVEYVENGDINGIEIDWEWPAEFGNGKHHRQELSHLTKELYAFFRENSILKREERSADNKTQISTIEEKIELTTLSPVSEEPLNLTLFDVANIESNPVSMAATPAKSQNPLIILRLPVIPELIIKGYDLKALTRSVDLFVVSTHNITANEESLRNRTYHHSRLMGEGDIQNLDSVLDFLISLGVPVEKIIPALPTFGSYFRLSNSTESTPYSPTISGPVTLTFRQICSILNNGEWTVEREDDLTGAYAFKEDQWIAFDDDITARIKAKYLLLREVPGAAVFYIDTDDTQASCGKSKYPVTKAVQETFSSLSRFRRKAVLDSLEQDLLTSPSDARPVYYNNVKLSPYRIVRVVDRSGYSKVHREATESTLKCSRQGYYRHPENCNYFYRCVKFNQYTDDFTVFEYQCPEGLVFDEKWEVCTYPSQTAACDGSSEIQPVPATKFICPAEGYYADPENCRWFFACKDYSGAGELTQYEFRCPFGLVFDAPKLICNWPWLVEGCGSGTYKPSYTAASYPVKNGPYTSTPIYAPTPAIIYKPGPSKITRKEPGSPGYLLGKVVSTDGQTAGDVTSCTNCKSNDLKVTGEGAVATASSTLVEDKAQLNAGFQKPYYGQTYSTPSAGPKPYASSSFPSPLVYASPPSANAPSYSGSSSYSTASYTQGVSYNTTYSTTPAYQGPTYAKPSAYPELKSIPSPSYPKPSIAQSPVYKPASPETPKQTYQPSPAYEKQPYSAYPAPSVTEKSPNYPSGPGYAGTPPASSGSYPKAPAYSGSYPKAPAYSGSYPEAPTYPGSYPESSGTYPKAPAYSGSSPKAPAYSGSYPEALAYPESSGTYPKAPAYSGSSPKAPAYSGSYPEAPAYSGSYPKAPAYSGSYPEASAYSGPYPESAGTYPKAPAYSGSYPEAPAYSGSYPESAGTYPKAPAYPGSYPKAPTYSGSYPEAPSYSGSSPKAPSYSGSYPETSGTYPKATGSSVQSSGTSPKVPAYSESSSKAPAYSGSSPKAPSYSGSYPETSGTYPKAPVSSVSYPPYKGGSPAAPAYGGSNKPNPTPVVYTPANSVVPEYTPNSQGPNEKKEGDQKQGYPIEIPSRVFSYPESKPLYQPSLEVPFKSSSDKPAYGGSSAAQFSNYPAPSIIYPASGNSPYDLYHHSKADTGYGSSPKVSLNAAPSYPQEVNSKPANYPNENSGYRSPSETGYKPDKHASYPEADGSYSGNVPPSGYKYNAGNDYADAPTISRPSYSDAKPTQYPSGYEPKPYYNAPPTYTPYGKPDGYPTYPQETQGYDAYTKSERQPYAPSTGSYTPAYQPSNGYSDNAKPTVAAYGKPVGSYSSGSAGVHLEQKTEEGQKVVSIKVPTPVRPAVLKKFSNKHHVNIAAERPAFSHEAETEEEEEGFGHRESHPAAGNSAAGQSAVKPNKYDNGKITGHDQGTVKPYPANEYSPSKALSTAYPAEQVSAKYPAEQVKTTKKPTSVPYHDRHRGSPALSRKPVTGGAFGFKPLNETLPANLCSRPGLFRHPDDCRKFYECYYDRWIIKYTLHVFSCPIKLVYDEELYACNWPFQGPQCVPNQPLDDYEDNKPFVSEVSV